MFVSLNNKIIANAAINAKLHVALLDSCSILDSLRISDHRTSHHTQNHLIQEHYSVHGRIKRALWHEPNGLFVSISFSKKLAVVLALSLYSFFTS